MATFQMNDYSDDYDDGFIEFMWNASASFTMLGLPLTYLYRSHYVSIFQFCGWVWINQQTIVTSFVAFMSSIFQSIYLSISFCVEMVCWNGIIFNCMFFFHSKIHFVLQFSLGKAIFDVGRPFFQIMCDSIGINRQHCWYNCLFETMSLFFFFSRVSSYF